MYSRQAQARGLEILSTTQPPTLRVEPLHAQIENTGTLIFSTSANSEVSLKEWKTKSTMDCHHVLVPFHRVVVSLRALCPQLWFIDAEVLSKGEGIQWIQKVPQVYLRVLISLKQSMENSIPKGIVKNIGDLGGELLGGAGASKSVGQPEVKPERAQKCLLGTQATWRIEKSECMCWAALRTVRVEHGTDSKVFHNTCRPSTHGRSLTGTWN